MGFFGLMTVTVVGAIIMAVLFTMNSNYLDQNINKSLDLTKKLGLRGAFTDEDRRANNDILRSKINIKEKYLAIMDEMEQHSKRRNQLKMPSATAAAAAAIPTLAPTLAPTPPLQ